jgi:hypothetical protein
MQAGSFFICGGWENAKQSWFSLQQNCLGLFFKIIFFII